MTLEAPQNDTPIEYSQHISKKEDRPFTQTVTPTNPKIIDGRALAAALKCDLIERTKALKKDRKIRPGLAIIRVGSNPASQVYVASKKRQCEEIGIRSFEHTLRKNAKQQSIIDLIHNINGDPEIHGLIVQLPLPKGLDRDAILQEISPEKDVDGLHPLNLGKLFCGIEDGFTPCTPKGCVRLIHTVKKDLRGLKAVILGASNLVGKPLAHLLLQEGCTIFLLNSKTKNPKEICATADIIVAATGVPLLVKGSWIKKGAIIIDVGINRLVDNDGTPYLVGDVDFKGALPNAKAITPVPGGVGPMTVACLLENTVIAAEKFDKKAKLQ